MFKLPVCPHCGTVYRYKDTKKAIKDKNIICYHCKKDFSAKIFPGVLVGCGILLVLCIGLNILVLFRMKDLQVWPLFVITLLFILLGYIIIPFFTTFKKKDNNTKQKSNKTKDQK